MKKLIPAFLALLILSFAAGCRVDAGDERILRVLVLDDSAGFDLALKGAYTMYSGVAEKPLAEGPFFRGRVLPGKTGLIFGDKSLTAAAVKVRVKRDANIYVNGRRFRGEIEVRRKDNQKLAVINYIGLEEYLYGVLYHEVSHRWPMEALKSQAIAARTFALYEAGQNKARPYDLRNDIYSQVYGGRTSEKWACTRAVNLTRGKVLMYKGNVLPAYYHAACAGYTEDASNLWKVDLPPLKGVPCLFCRKSPHYHWKREIALDRLSARLTESGHKIGGITAVSILSKNRSGRADKIEFKDASGRAVTLTGKDFRYLIGPNEVRSTKFDAAIRGRFLVIDGFGWGHGAGMCQWGAFGQARKGRKAEEILRYYYPGAEIVDIYKE